MIPNGAITIISPKNDHRTFEIKTKKPDAAFAPGKRILALLVGPDNTRDYKGFAFVLENDGIAVWRGARGRTEPSAFEYYARMIQSMTRDGERSPFYARGYRVEIEKRCLRCNRRLTNPESLASGIGPECAQHV